MAANYDEIKIRVPKGRRAAFDTYAKEPGESVHGLVNRFMRDSLGMSEEDWKRNTDDAGDPQSLHGARYFLMLCKVILSGIACTGVTNFPSSFINAPHSSPCI